MKKVEPINIRYVEKAQPRDFVRLIVERGPFIHLDKYLTPVQVEKIAGFLAGTHHVSGNPPKGVKKPRKVKGASNENA